MVKNRTNKGKKQENSKKENEKIQSKFKQLEQQEKHNNNNNEKTTTTTKLGPGSRKGDENNCKIYILCKPN